jgi:hypothetical protein
MDNEPQRLKTTLLGGPTAYTKGSTSWKAVLTKCYQFLADHSVDDARCIPINQDGNSFERYLAWDTEHSVLTKQVTLHRPVQFD